MEEDIHAPTTTAGDGAQNNTSANGNQSLSSRDKLLELIKQKDNLEAELSALGAVLDSVRLPSYLIRSCASITVEFEKVVLTIVNLDRPSMICGGDKFSSRNSMELTCKPRCLLSMDTLGMTLM